MNCFFNRALFRGLFFFLTLITLPGEPRLDRDSFYQDAAAWELPLSAEQISLLGFRASGLTEDKLQNYQQQMVRQLQVFQSDILPLWSGLNDYDKGEALLQWLHETYLQRYQETQTLMDVLVDQGIYNCVSSSVLYLIFAEAAGLKASGVETKDHAFCYVQTRQGPVDVETTNIYGFDPGQKKEFVNQFNQTGFNYVPPGNYRNRWEKDSREMASLILQNRIALAQRRNRHEEAVGLALDQWTLNPSQGVQEEFNSVLRNWTADLNNRAYYRQGFLFLLLIRDKFPQLPDNNDLLYSMAHNYIAQQTKLSHFEEARAFMDDYGWLLTSDNQKELLSIIVEGELLPLVNYGPYEEGIAALKKAFRDQMVSPVKYKEWLSQMHQNRAVEIAQGQNWLEAWNFLEGLPPEEKSLRSVMSLLGRMKSNWAVSVHNRFVDLFRQERYADALAILDEGLALDPNNSTLKRDKVQLEQIMKEP